VNTGRGLKKEMDIIWNERSRVINISWDSLFCNRPYAMVTNHLRAPYGVYFTKHRTILRRPAGGRKNRTIFEHFLRHRTVPGEV